MSVSSRTLTHQPTSVWVSESEGEEEVKKEETKDELPEADKTEEVVAAKEERLDWSALGGRSSSSKTLHGDQPHHQSRQNHPGPRRSRQRDPWCWRAGPLQLAGTDRVQPAAAAEDRRGHPDSGKATKEIHNGTADSRRPEGKRRTACGASGTGRTATVGGSSTEEAGATQVDLDITSKTRVTPPSVLQ